MGAPPPAKFKSTTKVEIRFGRKKQNRKRARTFWETFTGILSHYGNGTHGLFYTPVSQGTAFIISNDNTADNKDFDDRFKEMRGKLEQEITKFSTLGPYLSVIETTEARRKKTGAKKKK